MRKISRILTMLVMVCLLAVIVLAAQTKTLAQPASSVLTTSGTFNLDIGTKIGGHNPCNQVPVTCFTIILDESRIFNTFESGDVLMDAGTKIACQNEPGYPDNCHPL